MRSFYVLNAKKVEQFEQVRKGFPEYCKGSDSKCFKIIDVPVSSAVSRKHTTTCHQLPTAFGPFRAVEQIPLFLTASRKF
jgi:hypothetical protein